MSGSRSVFALVTLCHAGSSHHLTAAANHRGKPGRAGRHTLRQLARKVATLLQECHASPVAPLKLIETTPGKFSLLLNAGTTQVDALVAQLGHEPNGYFWEGVAQFLVSTEAPTLEGRFSYDPEGGMFCAYGEDRTALQELAALMSAVAADDDHMRKLIASAEASGFEFDD